MRELLRAMASGDTDLVVPAAVPGEGFWAGAAGGHDLRAVYVPRAPGQSDPHR